MKNEQNTKSIKSFAEMAIHYYSVIFNSNAKNNPKIYTLGNYQYMLNVKPSFKGYHFDEFMEEFNKRLATEYDDENFHNTPDAIERDIFKNNFAKSTNDIQLLRIKVIKDFDKCNKELCNLEPQYFTFQNDNGIIYYAVNKSLEVNTPELEKAMKDYVAFLDDFFGTHRNIDVNIKRDKFAIESLFTSENYSKLKKGMEIEDHLGNVFPSVNALCRYHNINRGTFDQRMKKSNGDIAYSLAKCRRERITKLFICPDGIVCYNLKELAKKYNIPYQTMVSRYNNHPNVTVRQLIGLEPISHLSIMGPDNIIYETKSALARAYNVVPSVFISRLKIGYTIEEALGLKERIISEKAKYFDHLGNGFVNILNMCDIHGVSVSTYNMRKKLGYPVEYCLAKEILAPNGKIYKSLKVLCKHFSISQSDLANHLNEGKSLYDAINASKKNIASENDDIIELVYNFCD